jgi:hypothetical protein
MADLDLDMLDLDAMRAARRETRKPPALRVGGQVLTLPHEVPLDVFQPITDLDVNLPLIVRQVVDLMSSETEEGERKAATSLVIDLLITRPTLPQDVLNAVKEMGRRLFDWDDEHAGQWQVFVDARPTKDDVAEIAKMLLAKYGLSLGEALGSTEASSDGGATSSATSSSATDSTPVASGKPRARKASSVPAAS